LSVPSVKAAAILWRNEVKGFKYWFSVNDDDAIARLIQELADKGMQKFVAVQPEAVTIANKRSKRRL